MAETGRKRVLVVDDETGVLRIIREALQGFLHCEVDTSPKPEDAFELALKKTYDLMIFDFSMALIDGTLLFHLIPKVYENSAPLLLVSGQGRMNARKSCFRKRACADSWPSHSR